MNNTITLTDEQMKALQSGQSITIEPPKPVITKWEPKGGDFIIEHLFCRIATVPGWKNDMWINSGLIYQTKSQAEQAAKALHSYARQLSWLHENDDEYAWINNNHHNYFVFFDIDENKYGIDWEQGKKVYSTIYMSKDNAIKLCQLLNDGIVEF